jgi:hypothetical protein
MRRNELLTPVFPAEVHFMYTARTGAFDERSHLEKSMGNPGLLRFQFR